MAPNRQIAQRTCVACRKVKAKRELLRLVRTPEGNIEIDTTGKKAGRGAYLCRELECWKTGLKGDRLERALRCTISPDKREQLAQQAEERLRGNG